MDLWRLSVSDVPDVALFTQDGTLIDININMSVGVRVCMHESVSSGLYG